MKTYITVAFLVLAGVANAQQMSRQQMHEVRSACEADVERLCNGVQPGGGSSCNAFSRMRPASRKPAPRH